MTWVKNHQITCNCKFRVDSVGFTSVGANCPFTRSMAGKTGGFAKGIEWSEAPRAVLDFIRDVEYRYCLYLSKLLIGPTGLPICRAHFCFNLRYIVNNCTAAYERVEQSLG